MLGTLDTILDNSLFLLQLVRSSGKQGWQPGPHLRDRRSQPPSNRAPGGLPTELTRRPVLRVLLATPSLLPRRGGLVRKSRLLNGPLKGTLGSRFTCRLPNRPLKGTLGSQFTCRFPSHPPRATMGSRSTGQLPGHPPPAPLGRQLTDQCPVRPRTYPRRQIIRQRTARSVFHLRRRNATTVVHQHLSLPEEDHPNLLASRIRRSMHLRPKRHRLRRSRMRCHRCPSLFGKGKRADLSLRQYECRGPRAG